MTVNKNDARILKLREAIATKKAALAGRKTRFAPITHCSLELDNVRYNLNVLDKSGLGLLACKLHSLLTAAEDLSIDAPAVSGYTLDQWLLDVQARLDVLDVNEQRSGLDKLEKQLETMLSSDKKTELELDNIEALLK